MEKHTKSLPIEKVKKWTAFFEAMEHEIDAIIPEILNETPGVTAQISCHNPELYFQVRVYPESKVRIIIKREFSKHELAFWGEIVSKRILQKYSVHAIEMISFLQNGERVEFVANEDYPMFIFDHENWMTVYQPKHPIASYRQMDFGDRPKDFIFGMKEIEEERQKNPRREIIVTFCISYRNALLLAGADLFPLLTTIRDFSKFTPEQKKILGECSNGTEKLKDVFSELK